ncbi:MAG: hypothetical protein DCC75_06295 [Proteobacteria bacterium]|nr:MAG: hypothetical protein DCC75_06295 [Pseudomonadota bacterium]
MSGEGFNEQVGNAAARQETESPFPPVKDKYDEIFELEIESWCYGFEKFPGELTPALVHRVVKELGGVIRGAINHNYIFDIYAVSAQIAKASKHIVEERELAYSLMVQLPSPYELDEEAQFILAQIVDKGERLCQGALERLERRWKGKHKGE